LELRSGVRTIALQEPRAPSIRTADAAYPAGPTSGQAHVRNGHVERELCRRHASLAGGHQNRENGDRDERVENEVHGHVAIHRGANGHSAGASAIATDAVARTKAPTMMLRQSAPEQVVHKDGGSTDQTGRQDEHAEQAPPDLVPSRQLQVPRRFRGLTGGPGRRRSPGRSRAKIGTSMTSPISAAIRSTNTFVSPLEWPRTDGR
jgi:hypothetical protein